MAKNEILDSVLFVTREIENLTKFLLISCENVREKRMEAQQTSLLTATVLYFIKFLYEVYEHMENEEIKKAILSSLRKIFMHLMCEVDYLNRKRGDYTDLSGPREIFLSKEQKELKMNFNFITFDILLNYLTLQKEPIITLQFIKALKLQDFLPLEEVILTKEWRTSIVGNEKINKLISDHYGGSIYTLNNTISMKIQDQTYEQTTLIYAQEKSREEASKKVDLEVIENAIEIYEQETKKRQVMLVNEEENSRGAKNSWRQLWKKLRVYVGQWAHPKFYDQEDYKYSMEDESYQNMQKSELFIHKAAKYETRIRARPYLKVKLIEPSYVEEYNKLLEEKQINMRNIINSLNSLLFLNTNLLMSEQDGQENPSSPMLNPRRISLMPVSVPQKAKTDIFPFRISS